MVDADHTQWEVSGSIEQFDRERGLVECSVYIVNGDRIVWVCGVTANIANHAQLAVRGFEAVEINKGWNGLGEIDAVDEDVTLHNFGVWAMTILGLCKIPLCDL